LAEEILLADDFVRQLMSVGEVDILVGIPSFNNAATIGRTVLAVEQSFQQGFARQRVVLVNADGGSGDGTREVVMSTRADKSSTVGGRGLTSLRTEQRVVTQYGNEPSAGLALRTILAAADLLRAKACAVISPATSNLTTAWITNLLEPIYRDNFDFVAPLYNRHKYDGLLARNLLYPMSRSVFGHGIRELHPSELGFSGRLASHCLGQNVWHQEDIQDAPEIWMALTAISSDFRCCQAFLGTKERAAAGTGPDIVTAVRQNVGSLFWCLDTQENYWLQRAQPEALRSFGPESDLTCEPMNLNRQRIYELFRSGVQDLGPILQSILAAETMGEIQRVAAQDEEKCRFSGELWARTLFEFAASHRHAVLNRDHMIQALVPLYRGRIYSFLVEHQDSTAKEMEADTENLCVEFEKQRPYLVERWKA
jgi:glycosyltransferase involved in cell wall biosynthesis